VTAPKGFKEAYAAYVEGGWPALSCDPAYGGQGLPIVLNQCFYEMLNSANQAWTMYPACPRRLRVPARARHARAEGHLPAQADQRQWTGTMCLTEPHCGTDLGLLRTKAEPQADGSYRSPAEDLHLRRRARPGREHRAPGAGAPAGRAGRQQGHLAVRGAQVQGRGRRLAGRAQCDLLRALEHKMGIHGNATCQMTSTAPSARWSASRTRAWRRCS
jgi:hypothetical protein